ncbi:putative membrane protein [Allocatelliglobosispora scoriae]|uniref:Putative membrane protein n=1 Tax=Allocatelliglobosispora scoriae TaxID=643052 RepID=A0A841BUD0_9ACTN|nr:phage holin family protein [Allocatelliglobosispora scoriae]MBB5871295.1 putative membrane protein [Allocatelliglobosispora scoriae]
MGILLRLGASAFALWLATLVFDGISVTAETTAGKVGTFVLVALIFGVVNAVLRPIIKTVGCAFYVLTLGLLALVVNALLFMLTSWIAGQLGIPFHVDEFFWDAVLGALFVGVVSWLVNMFINSDD